MKQLYRYCTPVDANYGAAAIAAMFTEDGVWDGADPGDLAGRAAIREGFQKPNAIARWRPHTALNPIIEIDGDAARCQWDMWLPKILTDGARAVRVAPTATAVAG